jgi:hypothetical protein
MLIQQPANAVVVDKIDGKQVGKFGASFVPIPKKYRYGYYEPGHK